MRVPFFDRALIQYVINIDPTLKKTHIEKMMLRDSFKGFLPDEILYRQKNGMSDAVGYSWVTCIRNTAEEFYDDDEYYTLCDKYTKNTPTSKEELYYRELYTSMFSSTDLTNEIWRPKWTSVTDPSAALLPQHIK